MSYYEFVGLPAAMAGYPSFPWEKWINQISPSLPTQASNMLNYDLFSAKNPAVADKISNLQTQMQQLNSRPAVAQQAPPMTEVFPMNGAQNGGVRNQLINQMMQNRFQPMSNPSGIAAGLSRFQRSS
jgi:hypothetical protein